MAPKGEVLAQSHASVWGSVLVEPNGIGCDIVRTLIFVLLVWHSEPNNSFSPLETKKLRLGKSRVLHMHSVDVNLGKFSSKRATLLLLHSVLTVLVIYVGKGNKCAFESYSPDASDITSPRSRSLLLHVYDLNQSLITGKRCGRVG